jgi:hypothetical protein
MEAGAGSGFGSVVEVVEDVVEELVLLLEVEGPGEVAAGPTEPAAKAEGALELAARPPEHPAIPSSARPATASAVAGIGRSGRVASMMTPSVCTPAA